MVHVIHEIQTRSRWLFLALKFTFLPQSSLQWKMKKFSSQIWRAVRNVNWLMKMYITLDLQRVFCKSRGSYAGLTTQLRLSDLSHTKSLFILLYGKYIQTWLCLEIQKKKKIQFACVRETCCRLTVIYSFCLSWAHVIPFIPPTGICTIHMHPHVLCMPPLWAAKSEPDFPSCCSSQS